MNLLLIAVAAGIYFISKNKKGINLPDATTKSAVIKNNIGPLIKAKADQLKSQQELVLQNKQNQNLFTTAAPSKYKTLPIPRFSSPEGQKEWEIKNNVVKYEGGKAITNILK